MESKIIDLLNEDSKAVSALIHLYNLQTNDEQNFYQTSCENGVGFNSNDASFLTSLSKFYLTNKFLSESQLSFLKKTIKKYSNQLIKTNWPCNDLEITKKEFKKIDDIETIMNVNLNNNKDALEINFRFPKKESEKFWSTLNKVKQIKSAFFDGKKKIWKCDCNTENVEDLKKIGFNINPEVERYIDSFFIKEIKKFDINLNGITLYPFQKEGVEFLEAKNGKALIADDCGLGKTIQSIAYLALHPELRPAIVICPASLKLNWERELKRCGLRDVQILKGKETEEIWADIAIINYDILFDRMSQFRGYKIAIVDECHMIKNSKAKRTKAVKKLIKIFNKVVFLSGTPIINKPIEFFNVLNILNPALFKSYKKFAFDYCGAKDGYWGMEFDYSNARLKELNELLIRTVMIRRLKKDVLKDLPEKTRSIVPFEIDNRKEYNEAEKDFSQWLYKHTGKIPQTEALEKIEYLKQLSIKGKIKSCIEYIENFLESDEKLVIFCTHHKTIDSIKNKFDNISVKLDGRNTIEEKQIAIDKFQNDDKIKLFIGGIKAAGVGITLTKSSNVIFLELGWTPGEHDQAEDRAHRIGQDRGVMINYLIGLNTIEEDICLLLDRKRKVLDATLDGKDSSNDSLLTELIDRITLRGK